MLAVLNFHEKKRFRGIDLSFNVAVPKDGSEISIDILDDAYCQPYDYQYLLFVVPTLEAALIVQEQVEKWMEYLQEKGVLSGHVRGEYI